MEENNELKVKHLILLANNQLEAHNFKNAKKLCDEALKYDSDNPNIYLILLLAKYEVTEIEYLQKYTIDFNDNIYKNLRNCADKELNEELDKYISEESFVKSDKNTNNAAVSNYKKEIKHVLKSLNSLGIVKYVKNEFKTLFEKPIESGNRNLDKIETHATFAIFFGIILLFPTSFIGFIGALLSDKLYLDSICYVFIVYLFWTKISRLNKTSPISEDVFPDKDDKKQFIQFIFKTLKHFVLFVLCIIEINIFFYLSLNFLFGSQILNYDTLMISKLFFLIVGAVIGIIPGLTVNYAYQKAYNMIRNINFILPFQ